MSETEPRPSRERLLETASDLFYRQGYLATGINQVIAEAGVAKASFYAHFPSKEALCQAYLERRHELWGGWLEAEIAKGRAPRERVTRVFDFLERWLPGCDYRGCAFLNIAAEIPADDSALRAIVCDVKRGLRDRCEALLQDLADSEPRYADLPVSALADTMYLLVEGAITGAQNFGELWPVYSARRALERLIDASSA